MVLRKRMSRMLGLRPWEDHDEAAAAVVAGMEERTGHRENTDL